MMNKEKRYKKDHFVILGIAFEIPAGIPLGFMFGNIAIGHVIGIFIIRTLDTISCNNLVFFN